MQFSIALEGIEEYRRDIAQIRERMRDMRSWAKRVATLLRACFAENFREGGRPEPWTPLAASTIAQKLALTEAGLIRGRRRGIRLRSNQPVVLPGAMPGTLISSGALLDSVARAHTKGNIERIRNSGQEIVVGSSIPYADVHDQGGKSSYPIFPKNGRVLSWFGVDRQTGQPGWIFARSVINHPPLPRRSFLVITSDTWAAIARASEEYVMGTTDGSE